MSYPEDDNPFGIVINRIDDSISTYPHPVKVLLSYKLLAARRTWLIAQFRKPL